MATLLVAGSATAAFAAPAHTGPAFHTGSVSRLGTATAAVASVGLDVKLLPVLGSGALDVPLNLTLNQQSAPADGVDENSTASVLRLRDGLLGLIPGSQSANLIDADAASSTVRTTSTYSQAYVTLANVRLFLPFVNLPSQYADDGVLRLDAVSAVATCNAGQRPSAQFQMPAEVTLFGHDLRLPANGQLSLSIPLLGSISLRIGPSTTTSASAASASVAASLDINLLGLAEVSGSITLASAGCTPPPAGAAPSGTTTTANPAGGTTTTKTVETVTSRRLLEGQTAGSAAGAGTGSVVSSGTSGAVAAAGTSSTPSRGQLDSLRYASATSPGEGAGIGLLQPLLLIAAGSLLTAGCLWLLRRRRPALVPIHARRHRR